MADLVERKQAKNRWPQVDLAALIQEFSGNELLSKPSGDERKLVGNCCPSGHGSKSGTSFVVWPDKGTWWCSSCGLRGDAAEYVAKTKGWSYAAAAKYLRAMYGPGGGTKDSKPRLYIEDDLASLAARTWQIVGQADIGSHPRIYRMDTRIAQLVTDSRGAKKAVALKKSAEMLLAISEYVTFYRVRSQGKDAPPIEVDATPPDRFGSILMAEPDPPLPSLRSIRYAPFVDSLGRVVASSGYHPQEEVYADIPAEFDGFEVPYTPTEHDVEEAKSTFFDDLLVDFPFESEADKTHALALALTPVVRNLFTGPSPLFLVTAPKLGTGKTKLSEVLLMPAFGRVPVSTAAEKEDELKKEIVAKMNSLREAAILDNLEVLKGGSLAAALTAPVYTGRILGVSEEIERENTITWVATGNNVDLSEELARRTLPIFLDPQRERPWTRRKFKHSNLEEWALKHRPLLLRSLLVLVRNWYAQGRPAFTRRAFGSFESWAKVVGGILEAAGLPGFLTTIDKLFEKADLEGSVWRAFFSTWFERHAEPSGLRTYPIRLKEVLEIALEIEGFRIRGNTERSQQTNLGMLLNKKENAIYAGFRLRIDRGRKNEYWLELVEEETPDPDPEPTPELPPDEGGDRSTERRLPQDTRGVKRNLIASAGDVVEAIQRSATKVVAFDTETTGLDPRSDRLRLVQIAVDGESFVLDTEVTSASELSRIFAQSDATFVAYNAKFDLRFLGSHGVTLPENVVDLMLMDQVFRASGRPRKLKDVAKDYCGIELDKTEQRSDWSAKYLTEEQLAYAARDAEVLLPIYWELRRLIEEDELDEAADLENAAVVAVAALESAGAPVDVQAWRERAEADLEAVREAKEALEKAAVEAGYTPKQASMDGSTGVNWSSPDQVMLVFEQLGVEVSSTRDEEIAALDHPVAKALIAYRAAAKRAGTYGLKWLDKVDEDGRVRASWKQIGADSGRMACTRPNLQQLPRGPHVRQCIRPRDGRCLIKADYSQIELRIAAELANETRMIDAYKRGDDLHKLTASMVLKKPVSEVTKEDRQLAKAVNFGLLYGMGARTLAVYAKNGYGVELTEEEAHTLRERFFQAYPALRAWHRSIPDHPVDTRTASGRVRRSVERFTEKLNTPVQGTGADGLKAALVEFWRDPKRPADAVPVLAIHDEIVVECSVDHAEHVKEVLVAAMKRGMERFVRKVPVEVDATIARDWFGTPLEESGA